MAFGIQVDAAFLVSSVLVSILYGFSVLMFIGTIWVLTYERRTQDIHYSMVVVATLLFLLSTADMVLVIIEVEDGFVKYRNTYPGGPNVYFLDFLQEIFIAKNVIYTLQTLIGDGVVIYRCYVVWQSVWIIILPCILWCSVAAFGICWVYAPRSIPLVAGGSNDQSFLFGEYIWITGFLIFTLATNLLSSGLVAYRIWTIERKVSAARITKRKIPILRVFVDAAILYSAALCSFIVIIYAFWPVVFYLMGDVLVPIISIAFYMVFIRIALSKYTQDGLTDATERSTLRFRVQPLQGGSRPIDMSWSTAQK